MPRIIDHHQRRKELAEAVWKLIRKEGLGGVTIRKLSQESGWSSGAIRHYLPNREAILTFAAAQINQEAEERIRSLRPTPDPRHNLMQLLEVMLPLEPRTRKWMEVWLAFVGAAVSDGVFADNHGVMYQNLNRVFIEIFGELKAKGWLPHHTPKAAAAELQAILDGLSVHLLLQQVDPQQAQNLLQQTVQRMLVEPEA